MSNGSKIRESSGDIYRGFLKLGREDRRSVALRIFRNQRVLGDLYDHFLIQESMREPGANVPWQSYLHPDKPQTR
jgi:hypothetical protein